MYTRQYQQLTLQLIQSLKHEGYSRAYIESKAYQMYGNKVGIQFIVDNLK